MSEGKLIVVEGIDGSGKSTLVQALREHLDARGARAVWVRDPGSTAVGAAIRRLLLDPANKDITFRAELLLYCASRAQMLEEVVLPALARGEDVISDRFYYSTLAYQGALDLMSPEALREVVLGAAGGIAPDFVMLLDAPAAVCLARIQRERDRMESRGPEYMEQVRQLYLREVGALPAGRRLILDAAQPMAACRDAATAALDQVLGLA